MQQQPPMDQLLEDIRARTFLREDACYRSLMERATISPVEYYLGSTWGRMTWKSVLRHVFWVACSVSWVVGIVISAEISPWIGFLGMYCLLEFGRLHNRTDALASLYSEFPAGRPRLDKSAHKPASAAANPTPAAPILSLPD